MDRKGTAHSWGLKERSLIIKANIWESKQSNDCTDQTLTIQRKYSGWLETWTAVQRCPSTTEFGDLEMLVFPERWKPEFSVQNLSGKGREPTNGNHIWCNTETWTKATHFWQAGALNGCTDNITCDICFFWEQYNSLKLPDIEAKRKRHPVHESNYSSKFSRLPL